MRGSNLKILPLKGEVSAQPTEGEVTVAGWKRPPPALRATSPFWGRI